MSRRLKSWLRWRECRLREMRTGGLSSDLSERLVEVELAARKRLSRRFGGSVARSAELIITDEGNLALAVDVKYLSGNAGALNMLMFYGADPTPH